MASSSLKCEELVRQSLIQVMVESLGYPRELIAIEKQLSSLPHVQNTPQTRARRLDLLCFAKGIHDEYPLFPLLLIECKQGILGDDAKRQALGYNEVVQAPFVALATKGEERLIYPQILDFLPPYEQLMEALCQ